MEVIVDKSKLDGGHDTELLFIPVTLLPVCQWVIIVSPSQLPGSQHPLYRLLTTHLPPRPLARPRQ